MMGREMGFNVVYGDCINRNVLMDFVLKPRRIKSVVVALDNANTARKCILTVKSVAPRVKIFARARNLADSQLLIREGIASALPETIESSFVLGHEVLSHIGVSDSKIADMVQGMRENNYSALSTAIVDKRG